ncbi:MAG: hypothetical protein GWN18_02020, partial [Thermoplasmata archaeon]|nr:VCBS repeat-containing protein [Thermoplasmata archaeon]NIS12596.1 VCBS repeat-containing protein [Thermoplasmata archaeon]NIW81363.1 hypothetical protein [Thermoplasmata archaeon]NIW87571.1 hypothetical protein [Thermoplasmata archaeon]
MYQVEVSGGDAHLATGAMDGWIASEIIRCPMGYRYDLVLLEVDTPGDSYVKVSVLDATMGPTQAGFANASIPEYRKVPATDVSLNHIDVAAYPEIRIQVNLYATATDRPSLLSWTVFFVDEDQWHDDFLGTGKLQSSGGLNITGGTARVRVGDKVLDVKDYDMYPTIGLPTAEGLNFFYCNSTVTGYGDRHVPITKDYWSTVFDDMNGDGYLDMVASDGWTWGDIYWGDETGTFSDQRKGPLNLPALDFATGDFNGDGWKDVAGAVPHGWGSSSVIMLNQGDGVFIKDVNISITGIQSQFAAAGDINGDGYDDVILNTAGNIAYVFFGGPLGPNPTPDAQIEGWWPTVVDLDGDGYEDVIEIYRYGFQSDLYIYMGGPDFDTERDYFLDLDSGNGSEAHAGDINGDGFMDLLVAGNGPGGMYIYPGSASGWDQDNYLRLYQPEGLYEMDVGDLNKDGYDDIVYNHGHPTVWDSALAIAYGGEDFPSDYDFWSLCPMTCGNRFMDVSIAIPKAARYPKHPRGSLVTED